jgi:hypothetical protein
LHGQFQGTARIPPTNKGADAFKELMKDFLGIVPHSGYKVQCKLLDISQPDEKMNAYCMSEGQTKTVVQIRLEGRER